MDVWNSKPYAVLSRSYYYARSVLNSAKTIMTTYVFVYNRPKKGGSVFDTYVCTYVCLYVCDFLKIYWSDLDEIFVVDFIYFTENVLVYNLLGSERR